MSPLEINLIPPLEGMRAEIAELVTRLDIEGKSARIATLETQAADPAFWGNPEAAQKTMQEISRLKAEVEHWSVLRERVDDALELAQLEDESIVAELVIEVEALREIV